MKWKYRLLDRNTRKYSGGVQQETGRGKYEVEVRIIRNTRKYSEGVQQETETEMYEVEVQITRQEHQKIQ